MTSTPKPHRSIGVMVTGSLVSAVCGVVLTFLVPKLLPLDQFALWRAFLLYAGYAGLLHFGLVDGALLLWSKNASAQALHQAPARPMLARALGCLAAEHIILLGLAALALFWPARSHLTLLLVALGIYALLFNLTGLLQVHLQAGFRFGPVAFGMSAPSAIFVCLLMPFAFSQVAVLKVLSLYLAAWAATLAVLVFVAWRTAPPQGSQPELESLSTRQLAVACIAAGWPVMLANAGYGFMQSADRVIVNLTRSTHDFAVYSLSQSTIYVPIAILVAVSRVAFSVFARTQSQDRAAVYRRLTRLLTLLWALLLPYYYWVELVVNRFLPRYQQGLPSGLILLFSVLFLSLVGIVQANTFNVEGRQRVFMVSASAATVLAFATAWAASRFMNSLTAVAWSQVVTAGIWWLCNHWFLRWSNAVRIPDILRVFATFILSVAAVYLGVAATSGTVARSAIYYAICIVPMVLLYQAETVVCWNELMKIKLRFETRP